MLDPHLLRNNPDQVRQALARRGYDLDVQAFTALEERRKKIQVETQELQAEKNARSREIGQAKAGGEDIQPLLQQVASLGDRLKDSEEKLAAVQEDLNQLLYGIPNIPHASVPQGATEEDNEEVRRWGEPANFDFDPVDHVSLGEIVYRQILGSEHSLRKL